MDLFNINEKELEATLSDMLNDPEVTPEVDMEAWITRTSVILVAMVSLWENSIEPPDERIPKHLITSLVAKMPIELFAFSVRTYMDAMESFKEIVDLETILNDGVEPELKIIPKDEA